MSFSYLLQGKKQLIKYELITADHFSLSNTVIWHGTANITKIPWLNGFFSKKPPVSEMTAAFADQFVLE